MAFHPIPQKHNHIIVAGAGPAGLLTTLLLLHHLPTLRITLLESWSHLDTRLRATQYGVPATRVFRRAGLLPDIRKASIESFPSIVWRKTSTHEILTGIDLECVKGEEERMTILPLNSLVGIMYEHVLRVGKGRVEVRFGWEVLRVGESEEGGEVWVEARVGKGRSAEGKDENGINSSGEEGRVERLYGDYLLGADGSKSTVRHCLFGRNWPGETFDCHLLVQNVFYDGFEKHGWDGGNYMIDPEYWGLIAKRGKGGLWRVTYGDNKAGLTDEEYEARREKALEHLLPGRPKAGEYKVEQTDHFRMHNRCVAKMRVGRVLLVGDAAHVNNPWGGYGCMAAVLDAGGLADCLVGVYQGKAGDEILDLYSDVRREKYLKYIDERSRRNYHRVRNDDPDHVLENDKLMKIFEEIRGNEEKTRAFLLKKSSIEYDFTQHYRQSWTDVEVHRKTHS